MGPDAAQQLCSYRLTGSRDTNVVRRRFPMDGSTQAKPDVSWMNIVVVGKGHDTAKAPARLDLLVTRREQALGLINHWF